MKLYTRKTAAKRIRPRRNRSIANSLAEQIESRDTVISANDKSVQILRKEEQKSLAKNDNLKSKRFKRIKELEMAYDDKFLIFNGQSGRFVRLIQEALMDFGFDLPKYKNDGIFGAETEKAVREFQWASNAILIDGLIGPETMGLLDKWAVNLEKRKDREDKQKERKNEKRVINEAKEILKEKEESLVPSPGTIGKIETNRIAQEIISMYFRHKKGEKIKDNFMFEEQVRLFFHFDMGDPKNGANPHYKSNVDKYASNNAFEQLDGKINPNTDVEKQVDGFVFAAERIAREMNGGFELFKSKGAGFGSHLDVKDFNKLQSYFQKRTSSRNDIYFSVTHAG